MTSAPLQVASTSANKDVWRVGYLPQPWAWPSWQYSTDGRFPGRWDDAGGHFRTIYAGSQLLSCLLEVLACFRPDPNWRPNWWTSCSTPRTSQPQQSDRPGPTLLVAASDSRHGASDGNLRSDHRGTIRRRTATHLPATSTATGAGGPDAAALKDARPRSLTQHVATYIYETTKLDGVRFLSRLGDDDILWAVFERPEDPDLSPHLHHPTLVNLKDDTPEILEAFRIHQLTWAED